MDCSLALRKILLGEATGVSLAADAITPYAGVKSSSVMSLCSNEFLNPSYILKVLVFLFSLEKIFSLVGY